jgi:hypothetical protein
MVGTNRKKILILDNDDRALWSLKAAFETKGYKTWITWSGQELTSRNPFTYFPRSRNIAKVFPINTRRHFRIKEL